MTNNQWPFPESTLFECCRCEHKCLQADKKPLIRKERTTYVCPKCGHAEFYYVKNKRVR